MTVRDELPQVNTILEDLAEGHFRLRKLHPKKTRRLEKVVVCLEVENLCLDLRGPRYRLEKGKIFQEWKTV